MTIGKKAWLLTLMLVAVLSLQLYAQFSGGSGTEADPYQVATATDLNNVRNYLSSHFIQTADIDLGVAPWNQGEGWVPIGSMTENFSGFYNGNHRVITDLFIYRPSLEAVGLFGSSTGQIQQLGLTHPKVIGYVRVGALLGLNMGTVIKCFANDVNIHGNRGGGLIGNMENSSAFASQCHSSGNVYGIDESGEVGGLVGFNYFSTISNSFSSCNAMGINEIGGFIGYTFGGQVTNCFSIGTANGEDYIGGFTGQVSYGPAFLSCYWDTTSSGLVYSAGGEGRTTTEMTYPYAANTYMGWDFDTIWHSDPAMLNGGYPYLSEDWLSPTENDLDAVLLIGDSTPSVNTATTYSFSVKNRGSAPQSEYTLKLFGTSDVELGSVAGTPIAVGEMLTYNFNWTPSTQGPVTLYAKVILSGDENPYNDQSNNLQVNVLPPYTLYFNDFEIAAGSEWSNTSITTSPTDRKFIGRFSNDTINYNTTDVPVHNRITVEFDLNIIYTWDGNGQYGVDYWEYSIDGISQLYTTFAIHTEYGQDQSYPDNFPANHPARTGAMENDVLGWGTGSSGDAVYHITKTIEHTGSNLLLSFSGSNLQGVEDESWGIDNILITYSDQPIPDLSVSEHSGQMPFTVSFTDASLQGLSPITSWAWDFNSDGTIDSNLQNPSWTYTQPGNYDVTFTVGDGTYSVTGTKENIIHVENSTLADGLVGYYPFSGDANDQSGRGNDGTSLNTTLTEDRYGRSDMAYYFDGSARIQIPETFMMNHPGDASFSVWLTRKDDGDRGVIWSRNDVNDYGRFLVNTRLGGVDLEYRSPDGTLHMHNGVADASFPIEEWTHIVVTRSENTYKTYLNGLLVKTDIDSNPVLPSFTGPWWLGKNAWTYAYGNIDDLRLYNRALIPIEIQRLYAMDSQSVEPLCRFSATPTSGVRPLQVQFTDESVPGLNPITSWAWDLNGDGQIESTEQHPSFVYPRPGSYSVTLTVSDGILSDTIIKTDLIHVTLTQTIPTEGLVAYYPFNGNANDESGNGHTTVITGAILTQDRFARADNAYQFTSYDRITSSTKGFPSGMQARSMFGWVKIDSFTDGYNMLLSYGNVGITSQCTGLYVYSTDHRLRFYTWNYDYDCNTILVAGNWYYLGFTTDGSTVSIYVNGVLDWSANLSFNTVVPDNSCYIGSLPNGYNTISGSIDDLIVFNRALSNAEIQELYNWIPNDIPYAITAPTLCDRWMVGSHQNIEWVIPESYTNITLEYSTNNGDTWTEIARSIPANQYTHNWMVPDTPSESCKIRIKDRATPVVLYESEVFEVYKPLSDISNGLIAYYPFHGNTLDESGNGHTTTNNGAVLTQDRCGNVDSAYYFSDQHRIVSSTENFPSGTQERSMFGWIKLNSYQVGETSFFGYGNFGYVSQSCGLYLPTGNQTLHFYNWGNDFSANYQINLDTWYHLGFVNAGSLVSIYVNGLLVAQSTRSFNTVVPENSCVIGSIPVDPYYRNFTGTIDDVAVHNRALTEEEVQTLFLNGFTDEITVIAPTNGVSLISGSAQDIFWYADSTISTVDIEYSGDNGITWQILADDLPALQYHYNWTVPDTVTINCKLRITANTGVSVVRSFSIAGNSMDAGLIAYYPLDGNADDASGNGRHGTASGLINSTNRFGEGDKSLKIDNKGDYILIPSVASTSISVSMWYRYEGTNGNWNTILCSANEHHSLILHPSSHQLGFWHHGFYPSIYLMQMNSWHHIVVVQSGIGYKLYVNNSLVLDSQNSFDNATTPLGMIGNYVRYWEDAQGSLGDLDDVRVYNRELNPSEIAILFTNGALVQLTGCITGSNNTDTGLGGVEVTLGENLMTTDTDGNGSFSFAGVSANSQYRLQISKTGYATQDLFISIPNYNYDLGTIILNENANVPSAVVASQVPAAATAEINWAEAARAVLTVEAADQGRSFLNYSLYRLLVGEEQNPTAWILVTTLIELTYEDADWYSVPFGVYKYAVLNNYSNNYQGNPVFSNELQRRNYTYSENFDHGGAAANGWTVTHNTGSTTTHPWMPVLDSGSDYSYKVMNTNLSTANETLLSPLYNCSRYEKVSVSFWHNYVPNVNSQARFQYSTNGVTWTTLFTYTSTANSGIKTYDISSAAHHQAAVRFRWLYTATSYNTNSWTIDDFSVFGYTAIPVYLADPYPVINRKVNNQSVELGITYIDDDMVNASSLYYRVDANGNGEYDTTEDWIPISGYANASQIVVRVQASYQTDGENLHYEFKGADLSGGTVKYSGNSHLPGIADDYAVDIDTVLPTDVTGFNIDTASFHSVSLSWQPVTEEHFAAYEIYYDTHRGVGLDSNKWSVLQDAQLENNNTTSTTINTLNSGLNYWFRIRAVDLHGNVSELSELLLYVSADLPPLISNPLPSGQPLPAWTSTRTVNIGCTFADYYGIDPASVQYRFDRNGNGIYDTDETWQNLPGRTPLTAALRARNTASEKQKRISQMDDQELELYIRNRSILEVSVPVTYMTDGPDLRFEFRASDLHGLGPVYTGFYEQAGIEDDWFVRIDSQNPAEISSIYIGVVNPSSIEVAWSRSNDQYFQTYEVYYATHPEVSTADQKWDWTNDPVLAYAGGDIVVSNITGLTDNTMYYFRVRAIDEAGNASPLSAEVHAFYGTSSPPALPHNLQIQKQGDDVILTWDAVTEDSNGNPITVTGYNIYASDLPDVIPDIGYLIDASTTTSYTHLGITPFVDEIFYIVTAVVEEEVLRLEKPNDQRLRTKK